MPAPRRCGVNVLRRAATAALLVAALVPAAAAPAWAHASLVGTTPGEGSVVVSAPAQVQLRFDEAVGTALGAVQVYAPNGARVDVGRLVGRGSVVDAPLRPGIAAGTYVVVWRVTSDDGHPEGGSFAFSVGRASAAAPAGLGARRAPWATRAGLGLGRLLAYAGLVLFAGLLLAAGAVWPEGAADERVRRLLRTGWWALLVGSVLTLVLEGPTAAARGPGAALSSPGLLLDVLRTRYGLLHVARIAALVAAPPVAAAAVALRARARRRDGALLVASGAFLAATFALSGHAGVGAGWPAWGVVDVVHVLAVTTWLGGLVLVGGIATRRAAAGAPEVAEAARRGLARWSPVAALAVAALWVTGTLAGVRETGSWRALTDTRYGSLLLAKAVLVLLMLALAAGARRRLRSGEWAGLRRSVGIEAAVGAVVLVVAANLVTTVPGAAEEARRARPPGVGATPAPPVIPAPLLVRRPG